MPNPTLVWLHANDPVPVVPWAPPTNPEEADVLLPSTGFYVEAFWLPRLGPTPVALLRRLVFRFESQPDGYRAPLEVLAAEVGVAPHRCRMSICRLVSFKLARIHGERLQVAVGVPLLNPALVAGLPGHLATAYPGFPPFPELARQEATR